MTLNTLANIMIAYGVLSLAQCVVVAYKLWREWK